MKPFQCYVERVDKYTVEFDENVCNEQWMEEFRQVFYNFHTLEEHAEHIAQFRARFGGRFIEGYGVPLENGEVPYWADEKEVNKAINIKVISEDNDIYVDVD
jgi:hypothetical protein